MVEAVEKALRDALAFAESIIDTMRDPLLVLDGDLRVVSAGRGPAFANAAILPTAPPGSAKR